MQLVLVDTCAVKCARKGHNFSVDKVTRSASQFNCSAANNDPSAKKFFENALTENGSDYATSLKVDLLYNGSIVGVNLWKFNLKLSCVDGVNVLQKLRKQFGEDVKICAYLRSYPTGIDGARGGNDQYKILFVASEGMLIDGETFTCLGACSRFSPTHFERLTLGTVGASLRLTIIAHVSSDRGPSKDASLRPEFKTAKKILDEAYCSDVVIIAGNGSEIKAHKCFLLISSEVIQAMFDSGMVESSSNRIDMSDMSEEGVKAFLRFIYYYDLTGPKENIEDAYELLYAAHKYDMPHLEELMIKCLLEWDDNEYWQELALRVYVFVRNIQAGAALKAKVLRILKIKVDGLDKVPEYEELFQKAPNTAMELCLDLAKVSIK